MDHEAYYDATVILACRMIDRGIDTQQIFRIIDEGLLMGQPDQFNTLQFICIKLNEKCDDSELAPMAIPRDLFDKTEHHETTIKQLAQPPTLLEWLELRKCGEPVLIKNAVNEWPALDKWDFDYFRRLLRYRTMPIEIGEKYTDAKWGQQLQSFDHFLDNVLKGASTHYLAQHPLLEQIPQLENDIIVPDYCFIDNQIDEAEVNAWIGPANTVSSLHTDNKHNLFVQIKGHKLVKLVHPKFNDKITPIDARMFNSSRLDVENEQTDGIKVETCMVSPGDMLYIPKLHWHYVRSLSASMSISMWF